MVFSVPHSRSSFLLALKPELELSVEAFLRQRHVDKEILVGTSLYKSFFSLILDLAFIFIIILHNIWNSTPCYVAAWMGGEFGGEWIHVYVWLSLFAVDLKLSQHIYSTIPHY